MNIREHARAVGGDELVADLDWGRKIELAADRVLAHAVDGLVEAYTPATPRRNAMIRVAIAEAISRAYAKIAVDVAVQAAAAEGGKPEDDKDAIIATAMRSVVGNLMQAWDDRSVETSGVADRIKDAAKKGDGK